MSDLQRVGRLQRPQLRVMLSLMGVPFNNTHGIKVERQKVTEFLSNPETKERMTSVYEAVVNGNFTQGEKALDPDDIARRVMAKVGPHLGEVGAVLEAVTEGITGLAGEYLKKEGAKVLKSEAALYKKFDIKVGRAARVKMTEVLPDEFKTMVDLAAIRQNIMLVGPSGSGKSFLAEKIARALKLPFGSQSCSAGMSESQLAGWLLPVGKGTQFSYVPSTFVNMYENGGVFLFDEMDAADENTLIFINAALANGSFHIPQRFENSEVKKHKDFVAVGAMNTFGLGEDAMYTGRNALDGATLDRFRAGIVWVGYSDKVETALVDAEVLEWGLNIREVIKQHCLERIMSTRVMLDFTKQKEVHGWGKDKWEKSYFSDWTSNERNKVREVIHGKAR